MKSTYCDLFIDRVAVIGGFNAFVVIVIVRKTAGCGCSLRACVVRLIRLVGLRAPSSLFP